jgi:hypothetical protein
VKAWPAQDWPFQQFDNQVRLQIEQIRASNLSVVYLACGDREMAAKVAEQIRVAGPGDGAAGVVDGAADETGAGPGAAGAGVAIGGGKGAAGERRNMAVVTKHDLFHGKDLRRLERLTFDQQGQVDFLVMLRASRFAGIGHSSFSWNVALRRHEATGMGRRMTLENSNKVLDDGLSIIMGYEDNPDIKVQYPNTMWA